MFLVSGYLITEVVLISLRNPSLLIPEHMRLSKFVLMAPKIYSVKIYFRLVDRVQKANHKPDILLMTTQERNICIFTFRSVAK